MRWSLYVPKVCVRVCVCVLGGGCFDSTIQNCAFRKWKVHWMLVSDIMSQHVTLSSLVTGCCCRGWSDEVNIDICIQRMYISPFYLGLVQEVLLFPFPVLLWPREARRTSTDLSKGSTDFQPGIAVCLNSQQFTAGENIEVAVSIQLRMHARAPNHTNTHTHLVCGMCDVNTYFSQMCMCLWVCVCVLDEKLPWN